VLENREKFFIIINNTHSTIKIKVKKGILVITFLSAVYFSGLKPVEAIGLSLPPNAIVKVNPSLEDYSRKPTIVKIVPSKFDPFFFRSKLLLAMYASNPKLASNPELLKLMNELRGGSWSVAGNLLFFAIMFLIIKLASEGFVINAPAPGGVIDRPNPFQPPSGVHHYPPIVELFKGRGVCYKDRPGGSGIGIRQPQSTIMDLVTQASNDSIPNKTQINNFLEEDGITVNVQKCLDELNRRAEAIGAVDFQCSYQRFVELSTENGEFTRQGAREALSALQGEIEGFYKNVRRENYGEGISGPDFVIDGIGKYANKTHIDTKGPVSSVILGETGQPTNPYKHGKHIGSKGRYQINFWPDPEKRNQVLGTENINPTAFFPASSDNMLLVIDNIDVPIFEQTDVISGIVKGVGSSRNIIILKNTNN
jgi:hypothetical protein